MQSLLQRPPHLAASLSILCASPDPKKYQQSHRVTRPCLLIPAQQILPDRPSTTSSLWYLPRRTMSQNTGSPANVNDPPYHGLPRRIRASNISHVLMGDLAITMAGAALPTRTLSSVSYLLSQDALSLDADLAPDTHGIPYIHARTVAITLRTCTPPSHGSLLPSFSVSRLPDPQLLLVVTSDVRP